MAGKEVANDEYKNNEETFFTGVIEGFYNRPWTKEQRLDLFKKLKKFGLNSYLYAPKDDAKHRSLWRDLYTQEECAELKELIQACTDSGVIFFYGISPGLDIKYSDQAEIKLLHAKAKQIRDLGCEGFAILWDDIEPELSKEDKNKFKSFSEAHCTVSNGLYEELVRPKFLFCPVEYCSSRATPNVKDSEYLQTIGDILHPSINVFWTGSKVVSKTITAKECQDLRDVIKRKPLLWDNLHANDYDHQRLFLGPYLGRDRMVPPQSYLSGAMTNPNCEYSLNIPAMLTLADWANNEHWDASGLPSHRKAVKEMLNETSVESYAMDAMKGLKKNRNPEVDLLEDDIDLIFQMFWLPHSHGPKIITLIEDFKFCKENAPAIIGWKEFEPGEQPDLVDVWIDKASNVNRICKEFFVVCDKMTHMKNRDLLFDLNSYLNNVRVILHACNNYLKWVGLDNCKKPIRHGPTLAGLPGGLAGDLMRLYPVQTEEQFPLKNLVTDTSSAALILPYKYSTGKHTEQLEKLFGIDLKTFSDFLNLSSQSFLVKLRRNGGPPVIVGMVSSWTGEQIQSSDATDSCSKFFGKLFQSSEIVGNCSLLVKLFADSSLFLDLDLIEAIFESLKGSEEKQGVVVAINEKNQSLIRFLRSQNFSDCRTDLRISGQELLCKNC
eukprot:GFUD01031502.1.p1 GENE.GFUD01031502.1~~GFUD01031502.1.p1  ORF type:complete len:664 (+),score=180.97 GFUD01031502.1:119-2110(+)